MAVARCLHSALREFDLPVEAVALVEDTARAHVLELLQLTDLVDLAIPRGGDRLTRFVAETAREPVITHYQRVCHLHVAAAAAPPAAPRLAAAGKPSPPAAPHSRETRPTNRR